jgi:hypothetical protein
MTTLSLQRALWVSGRVESWRGALSGGRLRRDPRRFPHECSSPVAMATLRFQLPPVEPCMRFSRTRLTDVLHRRHSAWPASPSWGGVRRPIR